MLQTLLVLCSPQMATRYDIDAVPPQGGYIAKQCPVVAHLSNDPTIEVVPVERPQDAQLRMDRGVEFESEIFAELAALHADAVMIDRDLDRTGRESRTATAMQEGTMLIIGGRLPGDEDGKRVGEPDVLLRIDAGYVPVDVKHHLTLTTDEGGSVGVSTLSDPSPSRRIQKPDHKLRAHEGDALQLAHYHRMLEAVGRCGPGAIGGIIGKEKVIVWYDLERPIWRSGGRMRTTLERYDFEFDFRLDIIAVALQRGDDPTIEPLVVPVRISDCAGCDWWEVCRPSLEESDDVSLLPRVGWPQWRDLHLGGITTAEELAALDWATADLIRQGVDLRTYVDGAARLDAATAVADVVGKQRRKQIAVLHEAGFRTAGDASRLDSRTIEVAYGRGPSPLTSLAAHIDTARARLGPHPVYRKRGVDVLEVPRADVEIDIDMENTVDDHAYLWGALVADGSSVAYHPFVSWQPMNEESRQQVFRRFWEWLHGLINGVEATGRSVAVYSYASHAEERHMRRGVAVSDTTLNEQVDALIGSPGWIDMHRVFDSQLLTGGGTGLKTVAALAGFDWRDEDPGGGQSMVWYEQAVAGDEAARFRLLAYNEDDVRATRALREWMGGAVIPSIANPC